MEKIGRKTLLWHGSKSESVFVNAKIEDLKSRAETYFRITPKKFFLSYKGLIFIYEDPLPSVKGLKKVEKKLEESKLEGNTKFLKYFKAALKEKSTSPIKVKILDLKRVWDKDDNDSEEEEKKEVDEESKLNNLNHLYSTSYSGRNWENRFRLFIQSVW